VSESDVLHVGRPNLGDREKLLGRINGMLDGRWLTNDGPLVREFEARIAQFAGVKNCVTMCNATVALEIASRALGFHGEVIIPSFTFVATAHALQWQGITPVFADIDPATHNIDPASIERLINEKTTGIVPVHVWGRPCDTAAIEKIALRHGLSILYDAAHAFGCSHEGKMIGGFGACEVFSFHATKFMNSFEGGAVVTNDDALAAKLRLMRNFGFRGFDNVEYIGVNGKMAEVCAAMGLTSLEAIDDIKCVNQRNYEAYGRQLSELRGVSLIKYNANEQNNWQYVVIEIDARKSGVTRDDVVAALHAENIIARKYFWPGCHRMEPYRTTDPDAGKNLPFTEELAARIVVLPTGQAVDEEAVTRVCSVIQRAIA
jgi:dTDP-4-amino-4,6-dideoxygalactose transaminase